MGKSKMKLASLLLTLALIAGMAPSLTLTASAAESHDGWTQVNKVDNFYNAFYNEMYLVEDGYYYLNNNIETDKMLCVTGDVTICLHGCNITAPADKMLNYVFKVEEGATLTIESCGSGEGEITNLYQNCHAALCNEGGSIYISGGNIGSHKKGIYTENGNVTITNGEVSAGIEAINLSGGTVTLGYSAQIHSPGCGINAAGGNIIMNGGSVENAYLTESAGIRLDHANLMMAGGEISGVIRGIDAKNGSVIDMRDGSVSATDKVNAAIYSRDSNVTISEDGYQLPMVRGQLDIVGGSVDISGGIYSNDPGAFLGNAYKVIDSSSSEYPFAVVEKDKFTVTFTDGVGHVISTQPVYENGNASAPADPSRAGYIFNGWDKEFTNITADTTVNATWKQAPPAEMIDNGKKAPPSEMIDLPAVKISKPKAGKKNVTVKWKKISKKDQKKIQGVQIQVATDPGFKNIVKNAKGSKKKTSKVVKGLKAKTKYYVRIRAYAAGNHYSVWKSKSVKIK